MNIFNYFQSTLSVDQQEALKRIESFLFSPDKNCFILKGYAGTGKTYLLKGLIDYLTGCDKNTRIMAPTGRASMVINDKVGLDIARTIHGTIYDMEHILFNEETFKYYFALKSNIQTIDTVYIIDESSMVSDKHNEGEFLSFGTGYLLKDLISFIDIEHRKGAKIIFIGDNAQLPPIGMEFSPALNGDYLEDQYGLVVDDFEMKKIIRQQEDSGILSSATYFRDCLEINDYKQFDLKESDDIEPLNTDNFTKRYLEVISSEGQNNSVIITSTNNQALIYNSNIREKFFPGNDYIQKGDILINTKNNGSDIFKIYNGQFLKVVDVEEKTESRTIRFYKRGGKGRVVEENLVFRNIVVKIINGNNKGESIKCKIIDSLLNSNSPSLKSDEQQALYVDFQKRNDDVKVGSEEFRMRMIKDEYLNAFQVKYGYAVTCHKAQGGEWDNVFVDFSIFMKVLSREGFRWCYTAITRAKKRLFAIDLKEYSCLSEFIVHSITKITKSFPNKLYIPSDFYERDIDLNITDPILKGKAIELIDKFTGQDVEMDITHLQWVERYRFWRGEMSVTIDFYYNKVGFTGRCIKVKSSDDDFAQFVLERAKEPLLFDFPYNPSNEFQKELFDLIKEKAEEDGLIITNVLNENYYDRFFINTEAECAYLDCIYNDKGIYTAIRPHSTDGNNDCKLVELLKKLS